MAQVESKWLVVVDSKEGEIYDDIISRGKGMTVLEKKIYYSIGGMHIDVMSIGGIKIVFDSPDSFHYLARKDNRIYLVEEKAEQKMSQQHIH